MEEKNLLEEMARIVSEIQTINLWIEDARTNRIARIRYQKFKLRLKELVETHKSLIRAYESLRQGKYPCISLQSEAA
jgi:hypothetical protein